MSREAYSASSIRGVRKNQQREADMKAKTVPVISDAAKVPVASMTVPATVGLMT